MIKKSSALEAEELLKSCDEKGLARLLQEVGFKQKIDPLEIDNARWYLNNLPQKRQGKPKILLLSPNPMNPPIYEDRTDYVTPFMKGFILTNISGTIAGYGTLDETFFKKAKRINPPHHFFFIDKPLDGENQLDFLVRKARNSPGTWDLAKDYGFFNILRSSIPLAVALSIAEAVCLDKIPNFYENLTKLVHNFFPQVSSYNAVFYAGMANAVISVIPSYFIMHKFLGPKKSGTYARGSIFDKTYGLKAIQGVLD